MRAEARDPENPSCVGLACQRLRVKLLAAGRDKQRAAVRFAERTRGCLGDRKFNCTKEFPVWRIVVHRPAAVHRHPDIPSGIDRETVGRGAGLLERHQRASVPWLAGGEVDVKLVPTTAGEVPPNGIHRKKRGCVTIVLRDNNVEGWSIKRIPNFARR